MVRAVPFYVTSNPFIADQSHVYCCVFSRFDRTELTRTDYFYIVELGAGTRQFGYYTLKRMTELAKQWHLEDVSFCYIITDFTENNVRFCREHKRLQPFLERGVLDFAIFDLERRYLGTARKKSEFNPQSVISPLSVIANYLLIRSFDVFRIKNDEIRVVS